MQPMKKQEQAPAPREDRLEKALARIREDARQKPAEYLRDSEVPGGGE